MSPGNVVPHDDRVCRVPMPRGEDSNKSSAGASRRRRGRRTRASSYSRLMGSTSMLTRTLRSDVARAMASSAWRKGARDLARTKKRKR